MPLRIAPRPASPEELDAAEGLLGLGSRAGERISMQAPPTPRERRLFATAFAANRTGDDTLWRGVTVVQHGSVLDIGSPAPGLNWKHVVLIPAEVVDEKAPLAYALVWYTETYLDDRRQTLAARRLGLVRRDGKTPVLGSIIVLATGNTPRACVPCAYGNGRAIHLPSVISSVRRMHLARAQCRRAWAEHNRKMRSISRDATLSTEACGATF